MLPHLVATNRQCLQLPAYKVYSLTLSGSSQGTVTVSLYFQDRASCADSNWVPTHSVTVCRQWLLC